MAIWQFCFFLVPKAGVLRVHGAIPNVLDQYRPVREDWDFEESHRSPNYWSGIKFPESARKSIADKLPKLKSWSDDAEMFGSEEGSRVEIWDDDVLCFFDARAEQLELLDFLGKVANKLECFIVLKNSGRVVEASYEVLLEEYEDSLAKRFVLGPRGTLEKLRKRRNSIDSNIVSRRCR